MDSSTRSLIGWLKLRSTPGPIQRHPHRLDHLLLGAPRPPRLLRLHDHEGLGLVRRLVVGAVLGVPLLAEHVLDLGELEQREAHVAQQGRPPRERHGARHGDGDVNVPLVHGGEELGAEAGDEQRRRHDHRRRHQGDQRRPAHGDAQPAQVGLLQRAKEGRVLLLDRAPLEQRRRQGGHAGEGEHQRPAERERIGQRHRPEDAPLDPLEREDRQHRGADDRHREQRRADHLLGGCGHHVRPPAPGAASLSPGDGRRSPPGSPPPRAGCRSRWPPSTAGSRAPRRSTGPRTRRAAPAA